MVISRMNQFGSSTDGSVLVVKPWRRVLRRTFFVILVTISKNRKYAPLLPTTLPSSTDNVALPRNPSPPAAKSQSVSIEISRDDEEACLLRAPVPLLGSGSSSFPTRKAPSPKLTHSRSVPAVPRALAEHDLSAPLLDGVTIPPVSHCADEVSCDHDDGEEEDDDEEKKSNNNDGVAAKSARGQHQLDRDDIRLMMKQRNLSLLRRSGGVQNIATVLHSDLEIGINSFQDQDLQVSTATALTPVCAKGYMHFLWEACNRNIIMLLVIAAILSFVTEIKAQGFGYGWYDGTAILVTVFILITVPSAVDFRRAKKLEKELLTTANLLVKVTRDGKDQPVKISEVVEGDVVKLEKDSIVPADGLFVDGNDLVLDEFLNPKIDPDHNPFLFTGSRVMSGTGTMLVASTVDRNAPLVKELGQLDPTKPSLLEARVNKPHEHMEFLCLFLSLFLLVLALVRVWRHKPGVHGEIPDLKGEVGTKQAVSLFTKILLFPRGTIPVLASSLSILVIGLQHGVPLTISLNLAYWYPKDSSTKIQNLWACMAMGITTDLYVDTTCGMVCDQMEVTEVWIGESKIACDREDTETLEPVLESLHQGIVVSARVPEISTTPRNSMLIEWANLMWRLADKFSENKYEIVEFKKLSSNKKGRGTLMRKEGSTDEDRTLYLHWKGAASSILEMCSHYVSREGVTCSLEERRENFKLVIKELEDRGLVAIAFASREMDVEEITENGLNLLAIAGLRFICSMETKSAVGYLRRAGICIVLVSEDEPSTLRSMARELQAEEGRESREEEDEAMDKIIVMGDLKPEENRSLVSGLKEIGKVVAFYGGSTSDISTLKETDLGIADRYKSTQMAQDSADVVLDKGIASLEELLKLGRSVY